MRGVRGFLAASVGRPGSTTYRNEDLDEIYKMEEDSGGKNPRNRAKIGLKGRDSDPLRVRKKGNFGGSLRELHDESGDVLGLIGKREESSF